MGRKEITDKSTYRLLSFRLSKYSTVKLDYIPTKIYFVDPFFLLMYGASQGVSFSESMSQSNFELKPTFLSENIPFIDIFEKTGEPVKRINVSQILKEHNLTFQSVSHICLPKLNWSLRQNFES